jgi:AraC-like DNA-binding protein
MQVHKDIILSLADNMHSYGYSRDGMLKRAGIDLHRDVNEQNMIDSEKGIALWSVIYELSQYEVIGISFGKNLTFSNLSWVAGLTQNSQNLKEAWKSFCDFSLLMGDMFFYTLSETADEIIIEYTPNKEWLKQDAFTANMACDHAMSLTLLISAYLCGQSIKPQRAEFAYDRVAKYHKIYTDIFADVKFDCKLNRLYFSKETASMKVLSANKAIYDHMYEFCLKKLRELDHKEKLSNKVRVILNQKNSFYTPKIEEVANMLNMSARTLQRKLKDEFISFQNIVEEVKLEQAKDLIARGDNTLKEIAYLVGYSSVQSFTRGFKNREGVSPSKLISK